MANFVNLPIDIFGIILTKIDRRDLVSLLEIFETSKEDNQKSKEIYKAIKDRVYIKTNKKYIITKAKLGPVNQIFELKSFFWTQNARFFI